MELTIKLFATFQNERFAIQQREYPAGTTVRDIVDQLGIDTAAIGVIMVNGRHADLDGRPKPGDVVAVFPVIGGG